jgi:hypothetical protein
MGKKNEIPSESDFIQFVNSGAVEYHRRKNEYIFFFWISNFAIKDFCNDFSSLFIEGCIEALLGEDGSIGFNAKDFCEPYGYDIDKIFKITQ